MKRTILAVILLITACARVDTFRTSDGIEYGASGTGLPVIVLGSNYRDTLRGMNGVDPVAPDLIAAGFTAISLDLPCHGADQQEPNALTCWARRLKSEDIFSPFCARLSRLIDHLGAQEVPIVGISRGGYVALMCAARDLRITRLALIAPVTDLARLTEFRGMHSMPAPIPADREILIRIGKHDERVGTDLAITYAQRAGAILQLLDSDGHQAPEDGSTTRWMLNHRIKDALPSSFATRSDRR